MTAEFGEGAEDRGKGIAFLHRLDGVEGEAAWALTDHASLRAASFLDGRETFWRDQRIVPLQPQGPGANPARRFVFHVGFCGSTLLARLLDTPGRVLALREPQCLADIAGQRQRLAAGQGVASIPDLLDHALGRLGEVGEPEISVVVKPTNWVNSLLPELCKPGRVEHALFVTMDRRAYLGAVFRGGRARLDFCTRLAAQIAAVVPRGNEILVKAIEHGSEPLDRAARIVALLHALQERLFDDAIAANGWPEAARIDFGQLTHDPSEVLRRARELLGLDRLEEDPERLSRIMGRHTKDPALAFRPESRLREDAEVESHHGARFDAALDWLESTWPPSA